MIGLRHRAVHGNIDNADMVQILVVVNPLQAFEHAGFVGHAIIVTDLEVDQVDLRGHSPKVSTGGRAITADDAGYMRAMTVKIFCATLIPEEGAGNNPGSCPSHEIRMFIGDTTVHYCDRYTFSAQPGFRYELIETTCLPVCARVGIGDLDIVKVDSAGAGLVFADEETYPRFLASVGANVKAIGACAKIESTGIVRTVVQFLPPSDEICS